MGNRSDGWLDEVAVRDWLDAVVEARQRELRLQSFMGRYELVGVQRDIHVLDHIREMASAAGTVPREEHIGYGKYPYRHSFRYGGMTFFQMSRDRLGDPGTEGKPDGPAGTGKPCGERLPDTWMVAASGSGRYGNV